MEPYAGTRFGRQELEAELLTDTPGALWRWEDIEEPRIKAALLPPLKRVVVAVDPAVTSGEDADETGIIVAGIDGRGHALCARGPVGPVHAGRLGAQGGWRVSHASY